jgi:L-threonylcarbamoyladenylate synthase
VTEVLEVDPEQPETAEKAIRSAGLAIRSRRLVVFPTETVYGLSARPDDEATTRRLFEAKRRPPGLSLPVLSASADQGFALALPTEAARSVADRFWPGPLTLVLPRTDQSRPWYLGAQADSIAVRVPDYPVSLALLEETGPLATTSANISGLPPVLDGAGLLEAFGDAVAVYLVLPPGKGPPGQRASTVLDLTGRTPRVVREGPIGLEALRDVLAGVQAESTR